MNNTQRSLWMANKLNIQPKHTQVCSMGSGLGMSCICDAKVRFDLELYTDDREAAENFMMVYYEASFGFGVDYWGYLGGLDHHVFKKSKEKALFAAIDYVMEKENGS